MAKLVLTVDDEVLSEHPINKECITIGRRPDNDIHIENPVVSGQHCQIITILNDSFIEDLNSTNGTLVNNKKITKHALANGDVIMLGTHHLKYVNEFASSVASGDDFEKTMVINTATMGMPTSMADERTKESMNEIAEALAESGSKSEAEPAPVQAEPQELSASLKILSGSNAGKELQLTKALTTLGKPGTQVAAISKRPQGFSIINVESSDDQQPMLNGSALGKGMQPLNSGDVIEVAGIKMEFTLNT
jgi:hypothetical protein